MAERTATKTNVAGGCVVSWAAIANNDTGSPEDFTGAADRSVQVTGTFDSGTVTIEGSNDGTNYVTLTNMQGDALTFTAAGLRIVQELTRFIRPKLTGAGGSGVVAVHMMARVTNF